MSLNETHRPDLASWIASAQSPECDFPIQNLPFGIYSTREKTAPRTGIAIGDQILDVADCLEAGVLSGAARSAAERSLEAEGSLNALMAAPPAAISALRRAVSELLRIDSSAYRADPARLRRALVPMADATMHLPARIGDYTDFYASIDHARNVGSMFRPDNPLLPNYKFVPIGYHGRASSIVVSGTPVARPTGQVREDPQQPPRVAPTRRLDYEVEVGCYVGEGNARGATIPIGDAERHLFGLCLVNDWSARDIQAWEYQPLGPFLAKSFATTVSPWVVTREALEPFRTAAYERPAGDPPPLPYLADGEDRQRGGFDIVLELSLRTAAMRERGDVPFRISSGRFTNMYWTFAQMLAHHTSNGCNLRPGDLLASGTVSGPEPESRGSLIERTWRGEEPLALPGGETRTFLEDGDEVILRGSCVRAGARRIGFGEARGVVVGGA